MKSYLVTSRKDIEDKIDEGTTNRSIAATNMNETSSRAHTIVQIQIVQKTRSLSGQETAKKSIIHLVDLAGRLVINQNTILINLHPQLEFLFFL